MSCFRPSVRKTIPVLNTAALPDMVFTILFFFMIVAHLRTVPSTVPIELPSLTELQKQEGNSSIIYIAVDKKQKNTSKLNQVTIQLNSDLIPLSEISSQLQTLTMNNNNESTTEKQYIAVLKIDRDIPMKIVHEIKRNLRKAGILTIHYSAEKQKQ